MEYLEIISNKGKLDFILNGITVLSTTYGDDNWKQLIAGSKQNQPDFGTISRAIFLYRIMGMMYGIKTLDNDIAD